MNRCRRDGCQVIEPVPCASRDEPSIAMLPLQEQDCSLREQG